MIQKQDVIKQLPKQTPKLRITTTLLNQWQNIWDCEDYLYYNEDTSTISYEEALENHRDKAYKEFVDVLNRIPIEDNIYMQKGREFEDEVCNDREDVFSPIVKNGAFQVTVKKNVMIDGEECVLYGVLDVLKAGRIYDIKRISKPYKSTAPKYIKSHQHAMYLYLVPEAIDFTYLIGDANIESKDETKRLEESHHIEHYKRENCEDIIKVCTTFIRWLKSMGLFGIYKQKWITYN